jgi:hypothetical protein
MTVLTNHSMAAGFVRPIEHEYNEWPAVYYGPGNQTATFHSLEEVPEGWADHPSKLAKGAKGAILDGETIVVSDPNKAAKILSEMYSQVDLLNHLKELQEEDATIEFSSGWPKFKLAQTIVAAGSAGPNKE